MPNGLEKRDCLACKEKVAKVDYKDVNLLRRFISPYSKILPARRTGACTKHQRQIESAAKRARHIALLPFVTKQQ